MSIMPSSFRVTNTSAHLSYSNQIYKQIMCSPFDSQPIGFLTEAIMNRLEKIVMLQIQPKFWLSYVDNTSFIFKIRPRLTYSHQHCVQRYQIYTERKRQLCFWHFSATDISEIMSHGMSEKVPKNRDRDTHEPTTMCIILA